MATVFHIILAIDAVLLILCILVQHRISGLSSTFGGSGSVYVQRRGPEKVLYQAGVVMSIIFFGGTILLWFVM
jgi:protein translocase SecG subunit